MRVLLLCLLQVLAKASWADVAAARVNGVEIEVARPSAISASTGRPGRTVASIRNPTLYKRLRDQAWMN